ncbi:alpha/beta-hydrolase [Suhomyces tanzawaensis NRRL Y-17324]|uniref:Alpha/beta-hydrolase n=1 Tax=Suhomyces tanzawaensis NRRL Y-17324 TaxID=984487 RepID=A0A1E4SHZ4_9ASCO|nr:alpha/beta-hydrolase [Suhomyces tanzawaensis NRRL Y-17324]ODV79100.1 alpha/beta-hydrolase [Suhomyces tanzawaensis NRRL Y-17324]
MSSTLTEQQKTGFQELAAFFAKGLRTPILRRPDEYGLKFEDVFFPSYDGVRLEGWFIPAKSNKLVICNHFMPGNRYGYAGHLKPYNSFGGFEVNFLPQYKALHDAGYNVLCYDLRNHGLSADGNGRTVGIGILEYRDVIGSLIYANSREDTKNMEKSLLSICLGANSTIVAMHKHPEFFEEIRSMIAVQPISTRAFVQKAAETANVSKNEAVEVFEETLLETSGFKVDELSPLEYAKSVKVPTKVFQVRNDPLTEISDTQEIFSRFSSKEKEFYFIEGADQRFQGYNFLSENPQHMLEWFDKYA